MTEDDSDFDPIEEVSVIDKIDILLTLIENGPKDKYKALAFVLQEAKFQLLHAWNEAQYYMELCEGYENTIQDLGDKLK